MLKQRLINQLSTSYENRVLILDRDSFYTLFDYADLLKELGYEVLYYDDVEHFRFIYETEIRNADKKIAIVSLREYYIPYDIRRAFYEVSLALDTIYPKLNAGVVRTYIDDIGLIDFTYDALYEDVKTVKQTESFIKTKVFSPENIMRFLTLANKELEDDISLVATHTDWVEIARRNAKLEVYAARIGISRSQQKINEKFEEFVFDGYQKLSGVMSKSYPAILPKVIDTIANGKTAIVVADGMSLFDFEIISKQLNGFTYEYGNSYAMIPTTTSISRQSLLSGKYPQQLDSPFSLAKEESGFYEAAAYYGYGKQHTFYGRGYDAIPDPLVRFAAIIINDIDDMVHGQKQGRQGMYNDISLFAKTGKLQELFSKLLDAGFAVYLTSDHGNTHCIGRGSVKRTGVETETKSKRMIVLKDFAEASDELLERTVVYPGYYMDKSYQYLICKGNTSFDNKNDEVMTHGGMSIEEVIVPFVKIRRNENG